jgi:hypothetical protein
MADVKVKNTSTKRVEVTVAGVVRRVKAVPLSKEETKETGRLYAQGVTPDKDGFIEETYTHRLVAFPGETVDVPEEAWEKFNANGAAQTHGLVVEG